jgi:CHAT domain-containing protein
MIVRRLPVLVLALCSLFAWIAQGQNDDDDARILEEDNRVIGVAERERAVTNLLGRAEELRNSGQVVEAVRTLNRVGRFQIRMFSSDKAVTTFQQSLKLLEQQPDSRTKIDSLNGLAAAYDWLSKCESVEAPVQEALSLSKQTNYIAGEAEALLTFSDCQNHNDHEVAFKTAEESLELYRSINRKRGMGEVYMAMVHYQLAQNHLIEAGKYCEAALELYTDLNDVNEQAALQIYLGYIEFRKGNWQDAIGYYTRTQAMIDEKAEPYKMGQIAAGIGEVFVESGSPEVALVKYRESVEYFRATKNQRAITTMGWLSGQVQYLTGDFHGALETLQKARNEAFTSKDTAVTAYCDDFLGRTYYALNDFRSALTHYEFALEGYSKAKNAMEKARVQALVGQLYQQQGNLEKARSLFETALEGFRMLDDRVNASATLYAIGKLKLQQNDLDQARAYLQQSIETTEDFRRASSSSDLTTALSAHVYERYETYVECLMRKHAAQPGLGQDIDAFETHELARARALTELLRATQTNLFAGLDPQLAEREKALRQSLRVKKDTKIKLLGKEYKREELTKLEAELTQLEAEYKEVEATIKVRLPAYDQITRPTKLTLRQIQEQVLTDDDTVLLEYALGTPTSYLWAITRGSFSSYELPARAEIEQSARDLYRSLTTRQSDLAEPGKSTQLAREEESELSSQVTAISKILLGPVADSLQHRRLLIVADGALQYIPFQVLTRPTNENRSGESLPLMMDHEIINEPSASTLALLLSESASRKAPSRSVAILADPVFAADDARVNQANARTLVAARQPDMSDASRAFRDVGIGQEIPRLLSSRVEADAIISSVPWRTGLKAVDFQANRATVMGTDLGQYRIVHFATHALMDNKHPDLSGIVLSLVDEKGQHQDGFLRLSDIYNLKLPVDLVVLSACQTGLGKDVRGEGLIGLTRGFMYAGASGVVASLWKVDDEATAELMKHFYAGLFDKGLAPSAALREAQLALRQQKRWHEPYYWAGFVIQGQYAGKVSKSYQLTPAVKVAALASVGLALSLSIILVLWRRRRRNL